MLDDPNHTVRLQMTRADIKTTCENLAAAKRMSSSPSKILRGLEVMVTCAAGNPISILGSSF